MNKRRGVGEIVKGVQATLLDTMRDAPGCVSRGDLLAAVNVSRFVMNRQLLELVECGMADFAKADAAIEYSKNKRIGNTLLYTITGAGRRALARYKRSLDDVEKVVVQPARDSIYDRPVFKPPPQAYYRNNGHRHIGSRGTSC